MTTMPGKLIVLYGINNLGKSTQAKILTRRLRQIGRPALYLKYPLYNLEPSGPLLNAYLRGGNPHNLSGREAQLLYALNRWQFQPRLVAALRRGYCIVAEDYVGTGLAWGLGAGVNKKFLLKINQGLLTEDIAILFEGQRFLQARENNHRHESDDELTERVRLAHQYLGKKYGWRPINANLSIEEVAEQVWRIIGRCFK